MEKYNNSKDYNEEEFKKFKEMFLYFIDNKQNPFHPFVWINGEPEIGENVSIGGFSEVNANGSIVKIGNNCDIASFVAINVVDSHKKCLGLEDKIERKSIIIGNNVFIGSHCFIGGGTEIGEYSVIGAGVTLKNTIIPPYSLVARNPKEQIIKRGYYLNKIK